VVLDDLQWADAESFALLEAILMAPGPARLMVVALARPGTLAADHPLERFRARVEGLAAFTQLTLAPLSPEACRQLVEHAAGGPLDTSGAQHMLDQVVGNPFLLRRLGDHLASLPRDQRDAGAWTQATVEQLLESTLGRISADARRVLSVAAAAGSEVSLRTLLAVSGLERAALDAALAELRAGRLVRAVPATESLPDESAAGEWLDVYHDRIRSVVYAALPDDERRRLHEALALDVERGAVASQRGMESLVRHWSGAGKPQQTRRSALAAAERAVGRLAFRRAAELLSAALELPTDTPLDAQAEAALWERAAELHALESQVSACAAACNRAVALWEPLPESDVRTAALLRLHARRGAELMGMGAMGDGRAAFQAGLRLLGRPERRSTAGTLATLAGLTLQQRLGKGRAPGQRAAPRAPEVTARLEAEVGFWDRMVQAYQPGFPWVAAEAALRCELLGRALDDQATLQRALAFSAAVPVVLERCSAEQLERAHRQLDRADALATAHNLPLGHPVVLMNRGLVWLATNMQRARDCVEAALEGFRRLGMADSYDGKVASSYLMLVLFFKGDEADAERHAVRSAGAPNAKFVMVSLCRTLLVARYARTGRMDAARRELADLQRLHRDLPRCRQHFAQATAELLVAVQDGQSEDALLRRSAVEAEARSNGAWNVGMDRSVWSELLLEAWLDVQRRRGTLPARMHSEARKTAQWLTRHGVFDHACMGHRALALLEHGRGNAAAAEGHLHRALLQSSMNASAHHRWQCLQAARAMNRLGTELHREADALAERHGFVFREP
jgi:hypothetical protein